MSVPPVALLTSCWFAICGIWVGLLIAQCSAKRRGLFLSVQPEEASAGNGKSEPRPTVSVVIPARNEGRNLAECVTSVLAQDCRPIEVVVADDRSDDDTIVNLRNAVGPDPRLRSIRIDSLPPGWLGKSHALWQATRALTGEWILFVDADCTLAPWAVRTAVEEAMRGDIGLMTLWPRIRAERFWEHLMIPLCAGIIALWYGSGRVNDSRSKLAFANGQFLLIRKDEYDRIGGHRAIRRAIIEDIPLAECAKRAGVKCHVASGRELFSVRMYCTYTAIRDGWARIYVGALRSSMKIALSVFWLVLGSLLPFAAALAMLTSAASGSFPYEVGPGVSVALHVCCGLHLALLMGVSFNFWGFGGCRRRYLFLYPFSVLLVILILCRAWWWLTVKRVICWSGTTYRINNRGQIVG
ncbi:MAG: glycosyltransferase family 2 protein [Phycisphaerae bacterium]